MSHRQCILVVEDDSHIQDSMAHALSDEDYEVVTASNGQEGIEALHRIGKPCLVLLDLVMPVLDGWGFLEKLDRDDVPIVVLSAHIVDWKTMRIASLLRKPAGFLRKPFELEKLLEIVKIYCPCGS